MTSPQWPILLVYTVYIKVCTCTLHNTLHMYVLCNILVHYIIHMIFDQNIFGSTTLFTIFVQK